MKKTAIACWALTCVISLSAQAQIAPAPRRMPRVPVRREALAQLTRRNAIPPSRQVEGSAAIIDGERLRVGETDIRLFGVVPPQLAASFGPQAREALDMLANGQHITCQIRDRDSDGRLLATCRNANGSDMGLELLKRGLAVTARGSVAGTDLADSYAAAEQAAQNQKIGLWSVPVAAALVPAAAATPPKEAGKAPAAIAPRTDEARNAAAQTTQTQEKIAADVLTQSPQEQAAQERLDDAVWAQTDGIGFFERYQILIAGFLTLATALSITAALWAQKRRDRLDEVKAIAAALRGELMAARGVCLGRAKSITTDAEDSAAAWPRIRITLYQAYVGRLGLLGAELARQIASIYGQSSDYAALYTQAGMSVSAPKKQALEMLVKHIDAVLPRLASIEQTGTLDAHAPFQRPALRPEAPMGSPTPSPAAAPSAPVASDPPPVPAGAGEPANIARQAVLTPTTVPDLGQRSSPALWEAVRDFIHTHRNAIAEPVQPDEHVTEYAEMIEADMVRYQHTSTVETLDISPQKKRL